MALLGDFELGWGKILEVSRTRKFKNLSSPSSESRFGPREIGKKSSTCSFQKENSFLFLAYTCSLEIIIPMFGVSNPKTPAEIRMLAHCAGRSSYLIKPVFYWPSFTVYVLFMRRSTVTDVPSYLRVLRIECLHVES